MAALTVAVLSLASCALSVNAPLTTPASTEAGPVSTTWEALCSTVTGWVPDTDSSGSPTATSGMACCEGASRAGRGDCGCVSMPRGCRGNRRNCDLFPAGELWLSRAPRPAGRGNESASAVGGA